MKWEEQAAENFKHLYHSALEFQSIEQIAGRLARTYENVRDYNEAVRTCPDIEPEAKVWLVVPS